MKKQNRQQIQKLNTLSKGTFKTNSDHRLVDGSFQFESFEASRNETCSFCIYKPIVLNKLRILKEMVEAKNEKIRQLETFFYNITNVALGQEPQFQGQTWIALSNKGQGCWGEREEMQEISFSQNKQLANQENRLFMDKIHQDYSSLDQSQTEKGRQIKEQMRVQIRKEIENLNLSLSRQEKGGKNVVRNEVGLKKKLMQIINVLPKSNVKQDLRAFQTLSQPQNQGIADMINNMGSSNKRAKNVGFLHKNQYESQSSKTNPSQVSQSLKSSKRK